MAQERYKHIFLLGPTRTENFTSPRRGGDSPRILGRDRVQHSRFLQEKLEAAWRDVDHRMAVINIERNGSYIDFISEPGFDLMIKSLEHIGSGIRLQNVQRKKIDNVEVIKATVYVPHDKRRYFLNKIRAYAEEVDRRSGKPKNATLINSISDIRKSVLESFWQDEIELLPSDNPVWIEVWLNSDKNEVIERFNLLIGDLQIPKGDGILKFPERSIQLIRAKRSQLEQLIEISDYIAEFRQAKEVASFFIELKNSEQLDRVKELLRRIRVNQNGEVAVTILDTGINNGHLLIQPILDNSDLHTVNPDWGTHDHDGHGTLMAGTVAYGDLLTVLNSGSSVHLSHRLESAKILPKPPKKNSHELWGHMTAQGISRAEIQAPTRKRITCMAVTATDFRDRGRPSSWSAKVDELTSGYEDNTRRFFIISAGNVKESDEWRRYPHSNLTNEIHDPGQAWNALTVGAYTEKVHIVDPTLSGYTAIAPSGSLSPFSTTSSTWPTGKWPIKPDVVFEGGNVAKGPNDSIFDTEDLKLVSTSHDPQVTQFGPFHATSAATALASWMAAQIQVQYPEAWPETIRALIVHTADWTDAMKLNFLPAQPGKSDYAKLLRICGYGVPNLERALYCAANSLTLISQAELQPYDKRDGRRVTRDMHLYNLPWPAKILEELGETPVRMRVTLSYFVEPGPGEVGWQDRYRYASHALRFVANGPGEVESEFIQRVNNQARHDGEHPGTEGPGDRWIIGESRNVGSVHSDIWQGRAIDLAASHLIGVYPAVGWWRERHHLGRWNKRSRYSLIVSIEPPAESVDIYTPVAIQVGIKVPIAVNIS